MSGFKTSANLVFQISFLDAANLPLNISGATVRFMMKASENDDDSKALVNKVSPTGVSITDAVNGLAECSLLPTGVRGFANEKVYCEAMAVIGANVYRTDTYLFDVKTNLIKSLS